MRPSGLHIIEMRNIWNQFVSVNAEPANLEDQASVFMPPVSVWPSCNPSPSTARRATVEVLWPSPHVRGTLTSLHTWEATRSSVVLEALCYKPWRWWFDTRGDDCIVSVWLILPAALGPGVYSASDRNKKMFLGVERGRCVRLITSPPPVSRLSRECALVNISQTYTHP
jgi:hypothetical protein